MKDDLEHGVERRFCELRADDAGRALRGVAIRYGDVATVFGQPERFEPGAFGDVGAADIRLTLHHDRARPIAGTLGGGLTLADSIEALRFEAQLPDCRDADDARALILAGVLAGASIEFWPVAEGIEQGVRVIRQAQLRGLSIVDRPAYADSAVSARRVPAAARRYWQ